MDATAVISSVLGHLFPGYYLFLYSTYFFRSCVMFDLSSIHLHYVVLVCLCSFAYLPGCTNESITLFVYFEFLLRWTCSFSGKDLMGAFFSGFIR